MLHLPFVNNHYRKIAGLTILVMACAILLAGITSSAKGPGRHSRSARQNPDNVTVNVGTNNYRQTYLVSDVPAVGTLLDPLLVNPWGLAFSATSPFWTANNGSNTATLFGGDVSGSPISKNPLQVSITGNEPTGVVFNGSSDFTFTDSSGTGAARFIFASLTGNISAWKGGTATTIVATQAGHVYTGLAIGNNGTANFLYAADFKNKKIDIFDKNFTLTTLSGTFTDPGLPSNFSPFNIQNLGGKLYVAYAVVDPATGEDLPGPGNGIVDIYDTNGVFQTRLISFGPLSSPWGMVIAPSNFGAFDGALLVGNFGNGMINAFNPTTGAFLGTLNDQSGNPLVIEKLWALAFGNGVGAGDTTTLYFTSGLGDETHGIFGKLQAAALAPTLIQFSSATYTTPESADATITVTRTGDLSQTATVNYAAYGNGQPDSATQKNDYIIANGTLKFASGEASKTFTIIVNDDVYVEGNEKVNLILSNPTSAALGSTNTAVLTITDNDTPNPVPTPRVFVATLTASQEVPPTSSTGKGIGIVLLANDEASAQVSLFFTGLTSPATAAHIHGPAAAGTNASILFPFSNVPSATSGSINNVTITLTPTQVQQLKDGLLYFNVHTQNNPNGEIRGQILFNPIDESGYFVTQQYRDFLNREPDAGGLAFWTGQISTLCGANAKCISTRRIDVSAAFFFSTEFQQTGFYVYRVRRASFGTQPTYSQYIFDRNQLGPTPADADRKAFTEAFVQRPEFLSVYPTTLTGSDFIDKLIATIKAADGVDLSSKKSELANEYIQEATQTASRARVLRKIIEYTEFTSAEFNPAFVLAEYFEYLRRDPDPSGYQFWLNVLNTKVPGNFRSMVCAFTTSTEYQQRFGPNATRSNIECDPAIIGQ